MEEARTLSRARSTGSNIDVDIVPVIKRSCGLLSSHLLQSARAQTTDRQKEERDRKDERSHQQACDSKISVWWLYLVSCLLSSCLSGELASGGSTKTFLFLTVSSSLKETVRRNVLLSPPVSSAMEVIVGHVLFVFILLQMKKTERTAHKIPPFR